MTRSLQNEKKKQEVKLAKSKKRAEESKNIQLSVANFPNRMYEKGHPRRISERLRQKKQKQTRKR